MGTLSVAQTDHLFWLGRYLERVMLTLDMSSEIYDLMLDGAKDYDVHSLTERLAIPDIYNDPDDFITRYLFDTTDPNSIMSNLNRAFDNAVVMRDLIHSETLCYIQLALNSLERGAAAASPMLEIQNVLDYLYAFWGSVEDFITDVRARYIMRTGRSIERIDLSLRMRIRDDKVRNEAMRLVNRLYRSGMRYDSKAFQRLTEYFESADWEDHAQEILVDIDNLVVI